MTNTKALPTINFSGEALKPGSSAWALTCDVVRVALEEFGCLVAIYDHIPLELHRKVFDVSRGLFDLPLETKAQNTSTKPFHGYSKPQHPIPLRESFGIEDAQDQERARCFTSLMWPSGNEDFSEAINLYGKLGSQLEQLVRRMMFKSYGVGSHFQSPPQDSTAYLLRIAKYRAPKEDENNIGSVPHTDKNFLTILHQNNVNGLEVQTKDGEWISYQGAPQSFVIMAGEALLAWSNNRIHAPIHRVVINGDRTRHSLALFSFMKGMIATPQELIDEQHPMQFKPFDHHGLLQFYYRQQSLPSESTVKDYCGI